MDKQIDTPDIADDTDEDVDDTVLVDSDPFAGNLPVDADQDDEMQVDETVVHEAPVGGSLTPVVFADPTAGPSALLKPEASEQFRTRWKEVQGAFVDEPRSAVQQADALVSEVIGQITELFASEHSSLEAQWQQGKDVSTEDLRQALQHYRSFFNRLMV